MHGGERIHMATSQLQPFTVLGRQCLGFLGRQVQGEYDVMVLGFLSTGPFQVWDSIWMEHSGGTSGGMETREIAGSGLISTQGLP